MAACAAIIVASGYLVSAQLVYPRVLHGSDIESMPEISRVTSGERVLVFSPHPDDETIGVGGYIAQAEQDGARVRVVLVTDGDKHHNEQERYSEFEKATAILGVDTGDLVFMDLPDGELRQTDQASLYQGLKKAIDDYSPDIVFYPHPRDFNPDHAIVGRLVSEILAAQPKEIESYQYLVHYEFYYPQPKRFAPDDYLLPPVRLASDNWNRFMLSPFVEQLKKEAIASYRSQQSNIVLKDLLLASIRRNELFAAP